MRIFELERGGKEIKAMFCLKDANSMPFMTTLNMVLRFEIKRI